MRSEKDNPLTFYQKYFNKRNMRPFVGQDHFTTMQHCQCYFRVTLGELVLAKFGTYFKDSKLNAHQFLAMERFGLTRQQVEDKRFGPIHYRALASGVKCDDLYVTSEYNLDYFIVNKISNIALIKDMTPFKINLVDQALNYNKNREFYLQSSNTLLFDFINGLSEKWSFASGLLGTLIMLFEPEQLQSGEAMRIVGHLQNLPYAYEGLRYCLTGKSWSREDTYNKLLQLNADEVKEWIKTEKSNKTYRSNKIEYISIDQLMKEIELQIAKKMKNESIIANNNNPSPETAHAYKKMPGNREKLFDSANVKQKTSSDELTEQFGKDAATVSIQSSVTKKMT
jgi:hypothetical protein